MTIILPIINDAENGEVLSFLPSLIRGITGFVTKAIDAAPKCPPPFLFYPHSLFFSLFPFQNFFVLGLARNYLIYMDFFHEQLRWEQKIKFFFFFYKKLYEKNIHVSTVLLLMNKKI